jgi:hypothetical protein
VPVTRQRSAQHRAQIEALQRAAGDQPRGQPGRYCAPPATAERQIVVDGNRPLPGNPGDPARRAVVDPGSEQAGPTGQAVAPGRGQVQGHGLSLTVGGLVRAFLVAYERVQRAQEAEPALHQDRTPHRRADGVGVDRVVGGQGVAEVEVASTQAETGVETPGGIILRRALVGHHGGAERRVVGAVLLQRGAVAERQVLAAVDDPRTAGPRDKR